MTNTPARQRATPASLPKPERLRSLTASIRSSTARRKVATGMELVAADPTVAEVCFRLTLYTFRVKVFLQYAWAYIAWSNYDHGCKIMDCCKIKIILFLIIFPSKNQYWCMGTYMDTTVSFFSLKIKIIIIIHSLDQPFFFSQLYSSSCYHNRPWSRIWTNFQYMVKWYFFHKNLGLDSN